MKGRTNMIIKDVIERQIVQSLANQSGSWIGQADDGTEIEFRISDDGLIETTINDENGVEQTLKFKIAVTATTTEVE